MPISLPGATQALLLETWIDPPLQAYFRNSTINWHATLVDPVRKTLTAPPSGGGLTFQWTNPPVQNTPQVVANTHLATGIYVAYLPLTMIGKVLLTVRVLDALGNPIDTNTMVVVVYPTGQ